MQVKLKYVAAWIGATLVAIVIASAAVGSVRSQVTDEALPLGSPEVVALAVDVTNGSDMTESSGSETPATSGLDGVVPNPSTTTTAPTSTTSTPAGTGSTTSTPSGTASTTSTPSAASTTTTTASSQAKYSRTFDTKGGSVRIVVEGSDVTFGGAVPKTGWSIELKDSGPEEVKVEFEQNGGSGDIEFSAKVEHGELKVEISGDDHDD